MTDLYYLRKITILVFFSLSECLYAAPWASTPALAGAVPLSSQELFIHPFQYEASLRDEPSFSLFSDGEIKLEDAVKTLVRDRVGSQKIEFIIHPAVENSLALVSGGDEIIDMSFSAGGFPICLLQVKALKLDSGISILGDIPKISEESDLEVEWPSYSLAVIKAFSSLPKLAKSIESRVLSSQRCWYPAQSKLYPVWMLTVIRGTKSYRFWVSDTMIYRTNNLFFDLDSVNGSLQAYERDPVSSSLKIFNEPLAVDYKNHLRTEFFDMDTSPDESKIARSSSADHEFIYPVDDERFPEVSAMVHVNQQYNFFKSLGYSWVGPKPLIVKIHTLIDNTPNNALYQPSNGSDLPTILIGDGDNKILKNLPLDGDVVSHEFGHHIIFRTITETTGESLVLHEGLADYFVFARTGDSCLGRSICVAGDKSPCVSNSCLRSADNKLQYNDSYYQKYGSHYRGQLISGFLVDLHSSIGTKKVVSIAYNALSLLVSNSSIKQFILALLLTDYKLNAGNNACTIYQEALSRGFASLLDNIDCTKIDSITVAQKDTALSNSIEAPTPKKSKTKPAGCGSLSSLASTNSSPSSSSSLVFFFIPFLFTIRRRE